MQQTKKRFFNFKIIILFTIIIGVTARLWLSTFGFNTDMEYWKMHADVIKFGGPMYEVGMNVGFIWAYILFFLDSIPFFVPGEIESLRYKVAIFLTIIDILLLFTLLNLHSLKVGLLFFLNPISIFITGYHSQFDNVAVFIGLLAVIVFQKNRKKLKFFLSSLIFGVSLITKHILFMFIVWIAIKEKNFKKKILIIFIPILIFLISFIPFVDNYSLVYDYVINYKSTENGIFWRLFTPQFLGNYLGYSVLFLTTLFILGLFFENKNVLETYYLYLIAVVLFSPAIANQYLAIPIIALAFFWNRFYFIYTLAASLFFLVDYTALDIESVKSIIGWSRNTTRIGYKIIIIFLALGFLQTIISKKKFDLIIKNVFFWFFGKIKKQFGIK